MIWWKEKNEVDIGRCVSEGRAVRKDSERNDGNESPVHCLQKGSHDVCHVILLRKIFRVTKPGPPLVVTLAYY